MELKSNQAALVLEESEEGEISVSIASPDIDGIPSLMCQAIAKKLMQDEKFQDQLIRMLEEDDGE